jgi:hypothetical protein
MLAKIKVTAFAQARGTSFSKRPYSSHRRVPMVKTVYMDKDIPLVIFVLIVFMACGMNEMVVKHAAIRPKRVVNFI